MVSQVPPHTNTHASSPQSPNTDQMPKHCFRSCSYKTTNSCRESIHTCWELLHCSSHELWWFLFVLPNSAQTWQRYEVVQKEFFLACFPQGNAGCQAKSINSHAKMIKRIILACCAQVGKCPIYSYCLAFISALLHFWPVRYMTWESFRRSCTYSHIVNLVYLSLGLFTTIAVFFGTEGLCRNPSDLYIRDFGSFVTCWSKTCHYKCAHILNNNGISSQWILGC